MRVLFSRSRTGACPALWGAFALIAAAQISGCGYRLRSAVVPLPGGIRSLAVPTFANETQAYKLEQRITRAVISEFTKRTRARITSVPEDADAVLYGRIHSLSSNPVTFGQDTFGSALLVTVQASARLVRRSDGKVLWENTDLLFRERYALNPRVSEFFSEQNPALERLARDLAGTLAGAILGQQTP
jgi:hypothetical protein